MTATRSATASASSWSCVTKTRRDAELGLDAADLIAQLHAHLRVERRERLVEQQHARAGDERAGERDALLLAARELVGDSGRRGARGRRARGLSAARRGARPRATLRIRSPNSTFSSTVRCGNSEYDWKTMPMSRLLVGHARDVVAVDEDAPAVDSLEARRARAARSSCRSPTARAARRTRPARWPGRRRASARVRAVVLHDAVEGDGCARSRRPGSGVGGGDARCCGCSVVVMSVSRSPDRRRGGR